MASISRGHLPQLEDGELHAGCCYRY